MAKTKKEQQMKDQEKILLELQKNAKENINIIAKRCGFTRQKVWRMVKKMEEDHLIWGYVAITDEQKQDLHKFILFLKRSMQKLDKDMMEQLASYSFSEELCQLGITIEDTYFVNDDYDWVIVFTAQDVVTAKRFSSSITTKYPGTISKIKLIQVLKTLRQQQIINPDNINLREIL